MSFVQTFQYTEPHIKPLNLVTQPTASHNKSLLMTQNHEAEIFWSNSTNFLGKNKAITYNKWGTAQMKYSLLKQNLNARCSSYDLRLDYNDNGGFHMPPIFVLWLNPRGCYWKLHIKGRQNLKAYLMQVSIFLSNLIQLNFDHHFPLILRIFSCLQYHFISKSSHQILLK